MSGVPFDSLPDPGDRFTISDEIRAGVWAKVSCESIKLQ